MVTWRVDWVSWTEFAVDLFVGGPLLKVLKREGKDFNSNRYLENRREIYTEVTVNTNLYSYFILMDYIKELQWVYKRIIYFTEIVFSK